MFIVVLLFKNVYKNISIDRKRTIKNIIVLLRFSAMRDNIKKKVITE